MLKRTPALQRHGNVPGVKVLVSQTKRRFTYHCVTYISGWIHMLSMCSDSAGMRPAMRPAKTKASCVGCKKAEPGWSFRPRWRA